MKKLILIALTLFSGLQIYAQTDGLPTNPDPGKCYVKCVTHDEFKSEEVRIMVRPEYRKLKVIPATYKWVEERVLVKEASKKYIYHPAVFKTVEVPYIKKEAEPVLTVVPAKFGSSSETIMTFPKTGGWEYTSYSECTSPNPEDCQVLCYKEKPERYTTVPIKTLESDATTTASTRPEIPAKYYKKVVDKPAWVEEIEIPAEYATIKRQVLDKEPKVVEEVVPAEYKTVIKQVLVKKGGITTWEEIDCGLVQPTELDILWEFNSAKLTPAAKKTIDRVLLKLLRDKPNISIELTSHTDSRGSDDYNMALSQRRADAIKNYLISRGIAANRLVSKGYGETRLKNNCSNGVPCTEAQHQQNRRTEYRVIGGN